ncbi:hypothetical protein [Leifsonia poae]|uniref:hypothetical protein n=1 Tax=Leifsonia poae TaxID=110933 RepID=UPI001CBBB225|nr:hypothetical protein [Leifsonia poae]
MTIPNDDSKPDVPADGSVPPAPDAGSVPPAPEQPITPAPDAAFPPAPPAAYPAAPPAAPPGTFPAYSAAPNAPVAAPSSRPSLVNTAFWLFIAAAVLSVISGIVTIASVGSTRQQIIDQLQKTSGLKTNGLSIEQLADASIAGVTALSIVTLIFWALVFVLFAYFMRRGANWARIVLTVLTVLSLINIPWGFFAGALQVIAAIVATILMWLKPSSAYFAAVKASKAPRA